MTASSFESWILKGRGGETKGFFLESWRSEAWFIIVGMQVKFPLDRTRIVVNNVLNDIKLFCASKKYVRQFFIFIRVQKYEMARGNAYVVMFSRKFQHRNACNKIFIGKKMKKEKNILYFFKKIRKKCEKIFLMIWNCVCCSLPLSIFWHS